jgi:endonuclease/exonuclease/phosphatase (EEP) superfamily protein YafD
MTERTSSMRDVLIVIGTVALIGFAWLVLSELAGISRPWLTAVGQTVLPWFILPAGLLIIIFARLSIRPLAMVAGLVTVSLTWISLWPLRPHIGAVRATGPAFTVAFNNIYNNNKLPAEGIRALLDSDADVVAVEELTTWMVTEADKQGAADRYPYWFGLPTRDGDGIGFWSRFPISGQVIHQYGHPALQVTLDVHGHPLQFWLVHPKNTDFGSANSEWESTVRRVADDTASSVGPTLVLGDFNSTLGHPVLRTMLDNGYREVHSWLGHGLSPSWPMDRLLVPPLFRIDHAFVRNGVAPTGVRELEVPGSDHRGFVATYVFTN